MRLVFLLAICLAPAAYAQEFSGKFTPDGIRLELVSDDDFADEQAKSKTLLEWSKLATESRSEQFRTNAVTTIFRVYGLRDHNKLDNLELTHCRNAFIAMLRSPEVVTRREAATALIEIKDKVALEPLLKVAAKDEDGSVRQAAMAALGALQRDEAVPVLFQAVLRERFADARATAAKALGAIGSEEAKKALDKLSKSRLDADTKEAVAAALDAIETAGR